MALGRRELLAGAAAASFGVLAPALAARRMDLETFVPVDGARLYLLVRGEAADAPAMLWLHGGPGAAERPLFRLYDGDLERRFVVGYLDQRGAGRSYEPGADRGRLTVAQHLADLDRVVDHLRGVLGRERLILVGHSWGSALGLLYLKAHPEKVEAFVGVAQVVSFLAGQKVQAAFVAAEARRQGDAAALRTLDSLGAPPWPFPPALKVQRLVERYGGEYHRRPRKAEAVVEAVARGYVSLGGIARIIRGNDASLAAMGAELGRLDLSREVGAVGRPVVFMLGRYDRITDPMLAERYLAALQAPAKRLVWFDRSAHNIPFEEPEAFQSALWTTLAGLGATGGAT